MLLKQVHHVDTRSDQQKTDDLIKQYLERLELTSKNDPAQDIEQKLNALKGTNPQKSSVQEYDDDDDNEETATQKIIKKAMAEAALQAKYQDHDELEEMDIEVSV